MNELFNWGEETPEQRHARLQWEHELLLEQARKRFNMIVMTGGAAGGGGAPSGDRLECDPAKGIGMYLSVDTESPLGVIKVLIRMEYQGDDEVGQPTYGYTLTSTGAGATLNYDYEMGKWKFTLIADITDVYYSDTLISSNWDGTPSPGSPTAGFTTCGYRELPVYCIDAGETGLVQPAPTWFESQDENTEVPPIWSGFALTFIWAPALGGEDGWYLFAGEEQGVVEGGSINELPLGEVALSGGNYVTVSEGACSSIACQPTGGLIINLDLSGVITEGVSGRYFIGAQGVENDKVFYLSYDKEIDAGDEFESWSKVSWNSDTELWEFIQYYAENGEIANQQTVATSADLYNSEWTMLTEFFPPIGTSPGSEFSCDWRYCVTFNGDNYFNNGSFVPTWFQVPLNESPNAYLTFGGGNSIFWSPEDSSWLVDIGPEPVPIGGTITTLPTGTFDLGEGQTLAINSGICAVEPLPEPTPGSTDFIIRIDTSLGNGSDSYTVPTNSGTYTYNYDVTWSEVGNPGNSGTAAGFTGDVKINFPSSGQYDISISGLFPAIYTNFSGDREKLIDIIQWGPNQWQSMRNAFIGCSNLSNYSATDTPNLNSVTDMYYMFGYASLFNGNINDWDVSGATNMRGMFELASSFNQDLSNWDVSNVTDMDYMFSSATSFNQDLSGWCVSLIPSEPTGFADNTIDWILPKPVWGTCP